MSAFLAAAALLAELTAAQIVNQAADAGGLRFADGRAELRLTIEDASGRRERELSVASLTEGGETRRLVRFKAPAEVAGVALLVIERAGEAPKRLLYLPSQHRVRPVGASQGGQAFMGTDFAYADLDLAGRGGEQHTRLADAALDGQPCFVIETKSPSSPYSKTIAWIHKDRYVPLKLEFYGDGGALLKTLKVERAKEVKGSWYAVESVMEAAGGKSRTRMTLVSLDPDARPPADELTERALDRR